MICEMGEKGLTDFIDFIIFLISFKNFSFIEPETIKREVILIDRPFIAWTI